MKKIILLAFLAFSITSLSSCIKLTKCVCTPGKTLSVNGSDDYEIRQNCESQSNGACTY
jgi:hypothetical protein